VTGKEPYHGIYDYTRISMMIEASTKRQGKGINPFNWATKNYMADVMFTFDKKFARKSQQLIALIRKCLVPNY